MAASREAIQGWLAWGKQHEVTHVIIMCDTYSYEDYPVYVAPAGSVEEIIAEHNGKNMQTVMEVYNLSMDIEQQLQERRAYHL